MVICGSYIFKFSVSKDRNKISSTSAYERSTSRKVSYHTQNRKSGEIHASQEGRWHREGSGTFMSNTNCQGIKKLMLSKVGGNNIQYNPTLNIIFSVLHHRT